MFGLLRQQPPQCTATCFSASDQSDVGLDYGIIIISDFSGCLLFSTQIFAAMSNLPCRFIPVPSALLSASLTLGATRDRCRRCGKVRLTKRPSPLNLRTDWCACVYSL